MIKWFKAWQNRRRRAVDIRILAPTIAQHAHSQGAALAAAVFHTAGDPAWRDASVAEVRRFGEACWPKGGA